MQVAIDTPRLIALDVPSTRPAPDSEVRCIPEFEEHESVAGG